MGLSEKSIISGIFWTFSERMAAQIVSVVVGIILARLLSPTEYGTVSLITVFIAIANVFVTNGFGTALIQKANVDNIDFSTVFYFGIAFSIGLYAVLFAAAPLIADFYEMPSLVPFFRALSLKVPIAAVNTVQQAYVSRHMIFKKLFYATLIGTLFSAAVGIFMAFSGYGAWSLVGQELTNTITGTVVLWITVKWRPNIVFSWKRLTSLFDYGWKLLVQGLLISVYSNIRSLLIGRVYSTQDLAYFSKGSGYPNLIVASVDTAMCKTLFPAMAKEQKNVSRIKIIARRTTQLSSYIMCPLLIGFMACAEVFTSVLLTDKWLPIIPFLRIICICLLVRPAQSSVLQAIKATGRSDIALKIDIPVRIFSVLLLIISIKFGVLYVAMSEIIGEYLCLIVYGFAGKKLINYSIWEIMQDLWSNILIATIMGICVWWFGHMVIFSNFLTLITQVLLGVLLYIILSVATNNKNFMYLVNYIKKNR